MGEENELCENCPVIASEMEKLAKGKFKDKVTFLIVNIKGVKKDGEAFKEHQKWKKNTDNCMYCWLDTAAKIDVMKLYKVTFVPYMFIMDKEGLVYQSGLGKEPVEKALDEFFEAGAKAPGSDNEPDKKDN